MTKMTGKDAMIEILLKEDVEYVFGLPGATETLFLDALQDHPEIKFILGLHETVPLGMAEGYSRASGKPAFVNLHTSTGLSAAVPLLINAHGGNVPLVITAGNQSSKALLQEAPLGEYDLTQMVEQFTKSSVEVRHIGDLEIAMRRAFKVATQAPCGPVFVSLPQDIMDETIDFNYQPSGQNYDKMRPDSDAIEAATVLLCNAKRPAIVLGPGIARDEALTEIVRLAEISGSPVFQSHMGDVNFPVKHPHYHGKPEDENGFNKNLVDNLDLLLVIGIRQELVAGAFRPKHIDIIQIDNDPWEIGKNYPVTVGIQGNIKMSIDELNRGFLEKVTNSVREVVETRVSDIKKKKEELTANRAAKAGEESDNFPMSATRLMKELNAILPTGCLIVDDSWSSSAALRQSVDIAEPRSYFRFRHGGSIGWGMSGCLGVKLACPDQPVVAITGDGSAAWGFQSLWTAAAYNIPVLFVVCANSTYQYVKAGKLRKLGDKAKGRFMGLEFKSPRISFWELAKSLGVPGQRVDKPEDLQVAFKSALKIVGPSVVEVTIEVKE